MQNQLITALAQRFPSLKPYQVEKAVTNYVQAMIRAIADSISRFGTQDDQISLALDKIKPDGGRIKIDGKNRYVLPLMHVQASTSLVLIDFEGNLGKNSRVSLNPIYRDQIISALIGLPYAYNPNRVRDIDPNVSASIEVQPLDLESYIRKTRETLKSALAEQARQPDQQRKQYIEALVRNQLAACKVLETVYEQDGVFYVDEYWAGSDSGRAYGHGLSLQRVPKHVRHAALGRCHMYDFVASSYALMAGHAKAIDQSIDISAITDYISDRAGIRKRLAQTLDIDEKRVKALFTSLGFGATTANNPHMSIRGSMSQGQYDLLMANQEFIRIKTAMDRVRDVIDAHYPSSGFDGLDGQIYASINPKDGTKRNKDQKLAWIHQNMESHAIQQFAKIAADAGLAPRLWTHDCLYYKQKLPTALLDEIQHQLQKTFPLLRFDHESIYPIREEDYKDAMTQFIEDIEAEHAAFMDAEWAASGSQKEVQGALDPHVGFFASELEELGAMRDEGLGKSIRLF